MPTQALNPQHDPREITDHKVGGVNEALTVLAIDEPGHGNACHKYDVKYDPEKNGYIMTHRVSFQNGPIKEAGVNGVTNEALLAIVIDRLRGFQSGEYACRENAIALTHIETALMWLQDRTRKRLARGVEGTSEK